MVSSTLDMRPPESGGIQELAKQNVKCSESHRDTACEPSKRNDKEAKAQQARKISELGEALVLQEIRTLDQQAEALGLSRSTAWTILKANHKASGLSAAVINSMLAAPRLPALVREKILEYIDEKAEGWYGHNKTQIRRFIARLSTDAKQVRPTEDSLACVPLALVSSRHSGAASEASPDSMTQAGEYGYRARPSRNDGRRDWRNNWKLR
jgi:predicted DNA-binding protein (UPF0251 family)